MIKKSKEDELLLKLLKTHNPYEILMDPITEILKEKSIKQTSWEIDSIIKITALYNFYAASVVAKASLRKA